MKHAPYSEVYRSYTRDESRYTGFFSEIAFPETAQELADVLRDARGRGLPVTLQGARTGITGSGIPAGGLVLSTDRLRSIGPVERDAEGNACIRVGAGVRLSELDGALAASGLCFLPAPGERSASLGGLFSNCTRGVNNYKLPRLSLEVLEAELVTAAGELWTVRRGDYLFGPEGCPLPGGGFLRLSAYPERSPAPGFLPVIGQDLLELFAAGEGMLAAVTGLRLRLVRRQGEPWAVMLFFPSWKRALRFASALRARETESEDREGLSDCIEVLDRHCLHLLTKSRGAIQRLREIPDFPAYAAAAVYLELSGMDAERAEGKLLEIVELFEEMGGREEDTWAASGEPEIERVRALRHALPESINMQADQTPEALLQYMDFTVPADVLHAFALEAELALDTSGADGWLFGHAGEGRLHLALLSDSSTQEPANALARSLARRALQLGGGSLSENGVGKTRRQAFLESLRPGELELLRQIKAQLDPEGLLNPGNMWEDTP